MPNAKALSYKDLIVWQKAMRLVKAVYNLTDNFPDTERYNLVTQMRKSAVSIPSNIAEGRHRGTRKDYLQFMRIAYASAVELETQYQIAKEVLQDCKTESKEVDQFLKEVLKMLNAAIRTLKTHPTES